MKVLIVLLVLAGPVMMVAGVNLASQTLTRNKQEWKKTVRVPGCRDDQNIEVIYPATYQAGKPQTVTIECNNLK